MEPSLAIESSESQNSLNRNKDFSFNLVLTWLEEKLEGLFQMEERPNKLRTVFTNNKNNMVDLILTTIVFVIENNRSQMRKNQ